MIKYGKYINSIIICTYRNPFDNFKYLLIYIVFVFFYKQYFFNFLQIYYLNSLIIL